MKQTSVFSKHGQIFLTVAEQLSVVKAADVLGMKQSSISYHLNQLEKELNVPLL
ncbi:LysR family transcriptional regulator, partial [Turicimonas muris]